MVSRLLRKRPIPTMSPGVFPDYPAPVVRNAGTERELTMMRWGMPPPPRAGGYPVTNMRNMSSPHWRGWLSLKAGAWSLQQLRRIRARAQSGDEEKGRHRCAKN